MHLIIALVFSLLIAQGETEDDEWLDPYDMLNYDAGTKTMRKPAEQTNHENVPIERREHNQDTNHIGMTECNNKVHGLKRELEDQKRKIAAISHQASCNPVFKRFLIKLLKEMERVAFPSDVASDVHYDAKVKLSRQAHSEIEKLLKDSDSWRTGALDDALSEILVDLKPHDHQAWRWHFEDTFGVEIDTVMKVFVLVLIIVAIICSEMWSAVSWFIQFRRVFAICFFISILWNWFYLYKTAFAERQNDMVKMEGVNLKCTGKSKVDWLDIVSEWYRSTMTLQDDPCKRYYEVLMVDTILLVPPTKAISLTITTFITEPLKHIGQAISEFLRALLKDLPITLQIPVLFTIVLSILVFLYGSVQAAFQHGIIRPLMGGRRDPPPPAVVQPQPQFAQLRGEDYDPLAEGDAPPPRRRAHQDGQERNLRHRRPNRVLEEPRRVFVETLGRNADRRVSEDEANSQERREDVPDAEWPDGHSDMEESDPLTAEDEDVSEDRRERARAAAGGVASGIVSDSQAKSAQVQTKAKSSPAKDKPKKGNLSADPVESNNQARRKIEKQPSPTARRNDTQVQEASSGENTSTSSGDNIETIGVPVQETAPTSCVL